ncbi:MAG TPA: diguanylate cyclase, partial [Dehalococcoidia bacterium]
GEGMAGRIWQTGRPLVIDDYTNWRGRVSLHDPDVRVQATVGVPLLSDGAVVGVLGLARGEHGERFTDGEVEILLQFARLAALALDNARLHEAARQELEERRHVETRLRRENEYRAALHEITLGLLQRHEVADLLDVIVTRAAALLDTPHGFVNLVSDDGAWLETTAGVGMFREQLGTRMGRGQGLAGSVLATGEPMLIPDYAIWSGRLSGTERDAVHACGAAPLRTGDEMVGVIGLAFTDPSHQFGNEELSVLVQFAQLASLVLDNARLYHEARMAEEGLRRQLDFTGAITNNLGEGVLALDVAGYITLANPAAARMLGWDAADLVGRHVSEVVAAPPATGSGDPIAGVLGSGVPARVEDAAFLRRGSAPLPASFSVSPILSSGRIEGAVIAFHDITKRKAQTAALEHQARHDALTGLPNRVLLRDRVEQAIRTSGREALPLALLVMDLDGFKEVNDTLGHQMGDVLLQQVARRLQDALRASDTVARMGGDEFAILLPGDAQAGAQIAAHKLLEALDRPFLIDGCGIDVGASIGIAVYPDHGLDAQTLLRRADVAMYVAKRGERGAALYASEHDQHSPDRHALLGELRAAIDGGQLELSFQPICDIRSRRVLRAEALVRWQHSRRGLIPAEALMSLAEQTGLINALTRWLLGAA